MTDALVTRPAWLDTILANYEAGVASTFVLHGQVEDYVTHPSRDLTAREYLQTALSNLFTVATFAPDLGIGFGASAVTARPARARFIKTVQPSTAPDPAAAMYGAQPAADPEQIQLPDAPTEAISLLVDFLARVEREDVPEGDLDPVSGKPKRPLLENEKRVAVIVDRLDLICPPCDKATLSDPKAALLALLHRVGTSRAVSDRGSLLILLAPSLGEIHPDLAAGSSGAFAVRIPPPDAEQRLAFIERLIRGDDDRDPLTLADMTPADLAGATAGLSRRHIEDIGLRAARAGGVVTLALVKARKSEQMATEYGNVLEQLETDITLADVGGHALAKAWLQKWLIRPAQSQNPELRGAMPKGVVFTGPPGTGKTFLLQATAHEMSGWNAVLLRGALLKGKYVGESEKLMEKAIEGIVALAPCLVYIDEMEQTMPRRQMGSGGDGGSAVEGAQFGRLLEFFGDPKNRGRIVAIGATNYPNLVDAAMFRRGRFDRKIPLLPPATPEERADVILHALARYGETPTDDLRAAVCALGERTDFWTQAELDGLVVDARALALIEELPLTEALGETVASMRASTGDVQKMTALALQYCDNLSLVPESYRASLPDATDGSSESSDDSLPPEQPRARRARDLSGL